MWHKLCALLVKDLKLMISSKFFLLALGSLVLYSAYINFIYVKTDQEIFPVYLYDPHHLQQDDSPILIEVDSIEEMRAECLDGYAVGIDASNEKPEVYMLSSGMDGMDHFRAAYAIWALSADGTAEAELIGVNTKEMKNRREVTAEVLFFELAAVGFLGVAAMLFKEKQMGVIRVHGILPVSKSAFILSKLGLILLADLVFAVLLTLVNLGISAGMDVLPEVLIQAGILSVIMALVGFFCAVAVPDFKQFSLWYLVLAVFVTTPVFLVGQTGITLGWINFHPMYHLFMAMKHAYFGVPAARGIYYIICAAGIVLLFLLAHWGLSREMAKEG